MCICGLFSSNFNFDPGATGGGGIESECGAYVRGADPDDQLRDVLDRFAPPLAPWTRCTACNGRLEPARKSDVEPSLLPGTKRTYQDFARCTACGRVYWRGAHSARLAAIVDRAARVVAARSATRATPA